MKIKQILFILLLIGILFTLTGVNASKLDDNSTDDANMPDLGIQTGSLKDIVINAKDNDTIYLEDRVYDGEDDAEITIDKSLTFIGCDNTVIDGKNERSIFTVSDNVRVSFKNIKFANAYKMSATGEDIYGAALQINNAEVTVDNCQFISNTIDSGKSDNIYGAAISNMGNLTILNSYFSQNLLNSRYLHEGFGGAIYNNGLLYVDNTSFIKSRGEECSRGSVLYNNNVAFLNNTIIAGTDSYEDSIGSSIFNAGNLTLLNSIVENNTAGRYDLNYIYGNIFNSGSLTAYNNIFRNNTGYYKKPNLGYEGSPTIYSVGDLNLSYNAFIDNIGGFKKIYTDVYLNGGRSVNLDNNWWGSNDNPFTTKSINEDLVNTWLIVEVTPTYSTLDINESVDIAASWKLSDGSATELSLPFEVTFCDEFGHFQKGNLTKECIFAFNSTQNKGLYTINVTLYSFTQSAIVDVGKLRTSIVFESNDHIYPNENLVVRLSLYDENSNLVNGKVSVRISSQSKTVTRQGSAVFTNLLPDTYELRLEYAGDDDHFRSSAQSIITVMKYPVDLKIETIGTVYVDEEFTINIELATEEVEGAANVYINGQFKNVVYLKYGGTIVSFSNFDEGKYNFTVEIPGNEYFQATNASKIFNVVRYEAMLNVTSSDIFIDENETLTITASEDFMGNVVLSINGMNYTLFINSSKTEITLEGLGDGIYDVDLIFVGNGKFGPENASTSFRVIKYPSNLVVNIDGTIINVKTLPNSCTGVISVYVNRRVYQLNLSDGEATFNVEYDNGTNYIYVFYSGDNFFNQSSFNTTVGEGEAVAIIGANVTAYEYNDFVYTVSVFEQNGFAMPNKTISVCLDSQIYEVTTDSMGIGILTLNLGEGHYEVVSTYKNLTARNHILVKAIEFNLTSCNVSYGEVAKIIAEFEKNVTGNVNFTLSNGSSELVSIIDGKAVYVIKNLTFGRWEVTAFYANGIFNSTSQKTSFEVEKLNPTIVLDIVEAFVGQTERIVARADGLKGNITFVVDDHGHDVGIIDGEASIFLSNLDGGRHTLKVIYSGDDSHKNATLECEFYIKTQETDIVISVNETSYGETITVVARVDGNAGGVMRFSVDGLCATSAIEGGIATWSFGGLDVGRYTIMADYSGDNQFISASKSADFRITRAQSTIEVYVDDVVLDENIRIYARVSPNATGKVSFRMVDYYSPRDKDVVNSTASWLIAPLMNGQYTIIATYRGDSNYYSSTTTYILNVSQTRSVLTVEANDVSKSDNVVIKITLMSRSGEYITDSVNVQIGSKSYRINVRNGAGTLNLGRLAPGNYTVQASYGGNKNYSSSKASCQFEVSDSQIESILTCENVTKYYGSDVKFVISLTNAKNKALSYQTVYITVKGVETAYISDEDGKIYIDINNTLEKYDVYGEFRGSDTYYPSNATGTIEVLSTVQSEDVVKLYGSGVQYFAIFKDFNGKALSNADVMFRIAGKLYNYTTFPNGIVRLNINLSPGTYEIVAMNPLTGENATNTLTIYNILMENSDVANYFGANSVYRVRAFGNDGKPVEGGNMVTFYVDGKTYHIKTDSNGYATLSVRLNPKQYVITAEFNGTRVSNIITVKPVLTTKITSSKKSKKTKFSAKLLDTNGNPLKGKKITFKIKGKKYKAKTNKKGIASIKIKLKLKKGTYKIYTIYGKSKVINKIKVK